LGEKVGSKSLLSNLLNLQADLSITLPRAPLIDVNYWMVRLDTQR
jgi:hypothetical protein